MSNLTTVLVTPLTTEKSAKLASLGTYAFEVRSNASKTEIKDAVEKLYGVKVAAVRTQNRPAKEKARGRQMVEKRSEAKIAFITTEDKKALDPNKITAKHA